MFLSETIPTTKNREKQQRNEQKKTKLPSQSETKYLSMGTFYILMGCLYIAIDTTAQMHLYQVK